MSRSQQMVNYRARLYERYGSAIQNAPEQFDEAASTRWGKAYDWYLRGWLPASKDARIVDLACGYGRLLHFLTSRAYRNVAGVDISPDQVRRARQVIPEVYEANVLEFLEAHPGEHDLLTALDLIEHLNKDEASRFLDACFAALRPGGRLILQTANADSPFGMAIRYGDLTHEICFNVNCLTRLLALHGFTDIKARETGPLPWGYSFTSTARWLLWQGIRMGGILWNLVETGYRGDGVLTRNFLIGAIRGMK